MAKKMRRMLAAALALCMLMSACPLQALAAEEDVVESTETSPEGLTTNVTTTTTTETDGAGNTTVTIKIEKETNGTTEDGVTVNREETSTESTITNESDNVIGEAWSEGGVENKQWTEEVTDEDTNLPKVEVAVKPGETVTETVTGTTTEVTGDEKEGDDDTDYDYTETTTTINREVTTDTSDITIEYEEVSDTKLEAVAPEDYEGKTNINGNYDDVQSSVRKYFHKYEGQDENGNAVTKLYPIVNRTQEEYDLLPDEIKKEYSYDEESARWVPTDADAKWNEEENGVIWDYVIGQLPEISTSGSIQVNGADTGDGMMIALYDKAGNIMYTYCMDYDISTQTGVKYTIENLDEATYFVGTPEEQEEAKAHVRAAALNGYWGAEEGTGSLEKLKAGLKEALENGIEISIQFTGRDGNEYSYDTSTEEGCQALLDLVDEINEGEALSATQGAIWSFGRTAAKDISFTPYKAAYPNVTDEYGDNAMAEARMELIRAYLISDYLKEKVAEEGKETVIIDEDSFLEEDGIHLIVGDKVVDHEANNDGDSDNDVYNADLNFKLAFVPGEKDDLLVCITYEDLDGNTVSVVKRLAGENDEGETYETITPEEDGSYVLKDLVLSEDEDFNFDLRLEGTQYLEEGVYMYKGTAGYDKKQTLVGVVKGDKEVDVSAKFTLKVQVNEEKTMTVKREWYKESDPVNDPPTPPTPPTPDPEEPVVHRLGVEEEPTVEIPEEEVPLANAPTTGDNTGLWAAVILMAAFALCAVNVFTKKRQHETF